MLSHAKSVDAGVRSDYTGKSEKLEDGMDHFAFAYAIQNKHDYKALVAAAKSMCIKVAKAEPTVAE